MILADFHRVRTKFDLRVLDAFLIELKVPCFFEIFVAMRSCTCCTPAGWHNYIGIKFELHNRLISGSSLPGLEFERGKGRRQSSSVAVLSKWNLDDSFHLSMDFFRRSLSAIAHIGSARVPKSLLLAPILCYRHQLAKFPKYR